MHNKEDYQRWSHDLCFELMELPSDYTNNSPEDGRAKQYHQRESCEEY